MYFCLVLIYAEFSMNAATLQIKRRVPSCFMLVSIYQELLALLQRAGHD